MFSYSHTQQKRDSLASKQLLVFSDFVTNTGLCAKADSEPTKSHPCGAGMSSWDGCSEDAGLYDFFCDSFCKCKKKKKKVAFETEELMKLALQRLLIFHLLTSPCSAWSPWGFPPKNRQTNNNRVIQEQLSSTSMYLSACAHICLPLGCFFMSHG